MSSKKDDIIGKQRKIAELMSMKKDTKKSSEPSIQVQKDAPVRRQHRPSLKRPSTSSVLAAARAQVVASRKQERKKNSTKSKDTESPKLVRKGIRVTSEGKSGLSSLANLVQNAAKHSTDDHTSASFATSPDEFWKNMREWNFVGDLHCQQQGKWETQQVQKPIPETFINVRHYVSVWGPKVIAEARAQILSEVITEYGQRSYRRSDPFVLVNVETTWKSGRRDRGLHTDLMDIDACHVQLKTRQRIDLNFWGHDICALIPVENKDVVETLLRGHEVKAASTQHFEDSCSKFGMIGHTESQRKELDGLILKVSKRRWAVLGAKQMYLLKVGSNITSLREFTALCKVETIPLKKYLLGNLLGKDQNSTLSKQERCHARNTLVEKMGGVQALGKGFTDYVQRKFNPSQLMAISAASRGYGDGGITLIKGPPGTGKTTMLVAVLNSLHIRQYNKYYEEVRRIAAMQSGNRQAALDFARKAKPRLLVCAPSNAGVDNVILRIMEDGFVDGSGQRYNPSMIRVGVGQSSVVRDVALQTKVDQILSDTDLGQLEKSIAGFRMELQRISADIARCRRKVHAIASASTWPLGRHWEIRVDEQSFDSTGRVFFVNHKEHTTTFECPPPPEPEETHFHPTAMPEYRAYMARIVKLVENYFSVKSNLERSTIVKGSMQAGANHFAIRQSLESHVLNSVHIVMTTLGSAGNRIFEAADKFEVVVVDEAAQSVEPSTLSALQLGSRHCVLVGDPQQLPATIFNVTGRNSKYDRSLFQRLEEAGQQVFMLNEQYRMHPKISHFPRTIFYGGNLLDGPNVKNNQYGNPLRDVLQANAGSLKPFTVLDLDSKEQRGGTSLANSSEAHLAVHLYLSLREIAKRSGMLKLLGRVAVITPYSQQSKLLTKFFHDALGSDSSQSVEVNTVDAFQGREANFVIFSAVRAAGSHGIGFLSDVRRMNVALTRAKHFLFVIARCESIVVNPYWEDLVRHARGQNAVLKVPLHLQDVRGNATSKPRFGEMREWNVELVGKREREEKLDNLSESACAPIMQVAKPTDPRKRRRLE